MAKMRCGVAVVEALRAVGATTIFGLMGSSTLEIYDALYDATDFTYIGVRHENCGMHMADAYGRVTQTPGVFICGQAGPGAANMVLGLAQAKLAYAPVVVITGLPATEHIGRDTFQEIDQHVLFQPVTKRTFSVPRPERIPEFILEAFRVANAGRRGRWWSTSRATCSTMRSTSHSPRRVASRWWRVARSMAPHSSTSRHCCWQRAPR